MFDIFLTGSVSVSARRYYRDKYQGDILAQEEYFWIFRESPLHSWVILNDAGTLTEGDEFNWWPVNEGYHEYDCNGGFWSVSMAKVG